MFKRAYTATMPDQPEAVVNCLRVSPHQPATSECAAGLFDKWHILRKRISAGMLQWGCYFSLFLFRMWTVGALMFLLWTPLALITHYKLCSLNWSQDMTSTAALRSVTDAVSSWLLANLFLICKQEITQNVPQRHELSLPIVCNV